MGDVDLAELARVAGKIRAREDQIVQLAGSADTVRAFRDDLVRAGDVVGTPWLDADGLPHGMPAGVDLIVNPDINPRVLVARDGTGAVARLLVRSPGKPHRWYAIDRQALARLSSVGDADAVADLWARPKDEL